MAKIYDLIVVGAGPAGLMAAKVAAENGLGVALLERKQNIAAVKRSCATMFAVEDDYLFGERMYFNARQGRFIFPVNGFSIPYQGPYKNFYAQMLYVPDGKACVSLGNYEENAARGEQGRLSVVYDKEALLQGMLREAEAAGVEIFTSTNVSGIKKEPEKVLVNTSEGDSFAGIFAVAADGLNSRLANALGLNKDRTFYGTVKTISCEVTGASPPSPYAYKMTNIFEKKHGVPITCGMVPKASGDDSFWLFIGGPADDRIDYVEELAFFKDESPFAPWFENVQCKDTQTAVLNFWSPIEDPFRDNVLVISDAAWSIEAEITGALMCGWKAAQAVTVALKDNKHNKEGVSIYLAWWQKSFMQYDYKGYMRSLAMLYVLTEEDVSYLFRLLNKPLLATLNPHKMQDVMNAAILEQLPAIQAQRPEILEKFQRIATRPLEELLEPLKKGSYPNK